MIAMHRRTPRFGSCQQLFCKGLHTLWQMRRRASSPFQGVVVDRLDQLDGISAMLFWQRRDSMNESTREGDSVLLLMPAAVR